MSDAVLTERRDGVLLITLNRPEARNAINGAVSHGLLDAVTRLDDDPELRAGVLTGAGQGVLRRDGPEGVRQGRGHRPDDDVLAVAASKELVKASQGRTEDELWELQQQHATAVFTSADAQEGARAFAEKRPPQWSGT